MATYCFIMELIDPHPRVLFPQRVVEAHMGTYHFVIELIVQHSRVVFS